MIRIMTVVLALLAGSVFASEPTRTTGLEIPADWKEVKPGTYRVGKKIVVTDHIPAELLPAFVKDMTENQFKEWAIAKNNKAYEDAKNRHDDYLAYRPPLTTMNLSSSSSSSNTRYGGGYGAGGFGGAGGYLGYNRSGMGTSFLGGGYGGGGYGGGRGGSFQGNNMNTTNSSSSQSWVKTFPDLKDAGGGPVYLINPFCFDYWRAHTE